VAERLGFDYVDKGNVARAAEKGGVAPGVVADEEQLKSVLGRMVRSGQLRLCGLSSPYL
jgi:aryl-alcohol dehydrogenase-like predicted oxidoreductase